MMQVYYVSTSASVVSRCDIRLTNFSDCVKLARQVSDENLYVWANGRVLCRIHKGNVVHPSVRSLNERGKSVAFGSLVVGDFFLVRCSGNDFVAMITDVIACDNGINDFRVYCCRRSGSCGSVEHIWHSARPAVKFLPSRTYWNGKGV